MKKTILCLLLCVALAMSALPVSASHIDPIDDNFRTFYQIFVGSFSDSNRDGLGDLRGIIDRMDYLNDGDVNSGKSLGIQGIWLSPIFSSPSYHKYDATDYYSIDWRFGRMEDLQELIDLCHERNVKLILDLVINHTSHKHPWFEAFKAARISGDTSDPYYDYYSCAQEGEMTPGVTYQKLAAGCPWWYECNFSPEMPELNFDNPTVREEVRKVAKFYLDMGIDGFRFDAVKYVYFGDTARSVDFWEWYMEELTAMKPDIYCVGECWSGEGEILDYYSAMNCFNFAMSQAEGMAAAAAKGANLQKFTGYVQSFQEKVLDRNPNGMPMPFLSNHDMDRIGGCFASDLFMRMAANLYLLSPGSPMIYYGEELGMRGSRGGSNTDANRRLAMLWGDEDLVRDPQGANYPSKNQITTTAQEQIADEGSLYNYYCKLLQLRHNHPAIARGSYDSLGMVDKKLGGFYIAYGEDSVVLLHNTDMEEAEMDLAACKDLSGRVPTEILDTIGYGGAVLDGTVLTIAPYTSVVLK